jgi:uncharacterized protein (TIGR02118 family)
MAEKLPGVVRMGMIRRRPDLTPAEFSDHWSGPHGVLATKIPNLRRYHQNHTIATLPFGGLPDRWSLDGLSELWFDDIDSMMRGITSPDYGGLAQDTPTVMTMPGLLVGEAELVVAGERDRPDKAMVAIGRNPALSSAGFVDQWRALTARLSGIEGLVALTNIFLVHWESEPAMTIPYDKLPVDVVSEFWFASKEAMNMAFTATLPEALGPNVQRLAANASAYAMKTYVIKT